MANEEKEIKGPEDLTSKPAEMLELDATENAAAEPAQEDVTDEPAAQSTETVEASTPVETSEEPAPVEASAEAPVAPVTSEESSVPTAATEAEPTDVSDAQAVSTDEAPAEELPADAEVPSILDEAAPQAEVVAETAAPEAEVAPADAIEPSVAEEISADYADTETAEEEAAAQPAIDYSQFGKAEFVTLLQEQLTTISAEGVTPGDFKRADAILKEAKPLFDQLKAGDRQSALSKYTEENGSDEGFEFKYDESVNQFDALYKQIKSLKNTYFQNLDKAKDSNFATKTELLRRLRELVENDENSAADPKASWNEFKQVQDEWKAAGNINSPHNATLWATYHALVDRYYSNRNIYFELKELDRKRNATLKTEVIQKVEAMAQELADKPVSRQTIDEANALFEEYKHIGPAPKAEQEVLWGRMKAALDTLYERRRGQTEEQRKESAQLYEEKSKIYEELVPFTSFSSSSINDWNDKTKEVMAIQDRWNALKGSMPREEGKELSKKFWATLKSFFYNKGEFFKELEAKREQNLKAKTELCEQVEAILESGEDTPELTQRVIELQRQWKNIGQVPEKFKNSIFDRFKNACDSFFNRKRNKNQETEREFEDNLAKKNELIARIEAAASEGADLSQMNEFKREWSSIGFVPKRDMQATQKRYINAINALVGAMGKMTQKEKDRVIQETEAEVNQGRRGGGNRGDRDRDSYRRGGHGDGDSRGGDIRRRITALENDIATYRNNIEFFARSKNADKLRADIDKKIADAQKQLDDLRNQLRAAQSA
ncbi:DUF349 domain-containing protein [Rudanella lutea]|uniref:DUF349 domain-containing protein n=1 Tax=Rudanella lutea TaxID=451374 RepID=UPI000364D4CF|nr:DUF349 domain-containing protein [Rudanella lutea]